MRTLCRWRCLCYEVWLRHGRYTGRCYWCSSQGGNPALRGSWRVSAWQPGCCRTPGTQYIGRVRPHRGSAGAWSWLSSPASADHRDDTRRVSPLKHRDERIGGHRKEGSGGGGGGGIGVITSERVFHLWHCKGNSCHCQINSVLPVLQHHPLSAKFIAKSTEVWVWTFMHDLLMTYMHFHWIRSLLWLCINVAINWTQIHHLQQK